MTLLHEIASRQYVGQRAVAEMLSVSVRTLQRLREDDPTFPQPSKNGKQRLYWRAAEVIAWDDNRRARRQQAVVARAVGDPEHLSDEELQDAIPLVLGEWARRHEITWDRLCEAVGDNSGVGVLTATFASLDGIRAWRVIAGLIPALRGDAERALLRLEGEAPSETQSELRDAALLLLAQATLAVREKGDAAVQ